MASFQTPITSDPSEVPAGKSASVYGIVMVISSFKLEIGDPAESTASIDTAFLDKIAPLGGFGIAVLILVVTVAALEPVPKALAGKFTLNPLPISLLVRNPPEVGVTVSGRSALIVKPEIAVKARFWLDGLLLLTVTGKGPPS